MCYWTEWRRMVDSRSPIVSVSSSISLVPSSLISEHPQECIWKGVEFLLSERQPGKRGQLPSPIWYYGSDYIKPANLNTHAWRFDISVKDYLIPLISALTSNAGKHLQRTEARPKKCVDANF